MAARQIPAQPTGKDFLRSSSVLVVRDNDSITSDQLYLTTCQNDFRLNSGQLSRNGPIAKPALAQVEHTDQRILERGTETLSSFKCPPGPLAIHRIPAWTRLGTSVKMHGDPQLPTFLTIQQQGFLPPPVSSATKLIHPKDAKLFSGGHKGLPQSTYEETFPVCSVMPMVRAAAKHLGGDPTITGAKGRVCFTTHNMEAFQGAWCPPPAPMERQFRSSVAMGDPEKLVERETIQTSSFRHPGAPRPPGVMERLKVNLGDTDNRWVSTTAEAYQTVKPELMMRRHRTTQSSMPLGDMDPAANMARLKTSNDGAFSEENHKELPKHVDGSQLRTRSNVQFGRPSLGKMFYSTSSRLDYPRKDGVRPQPHTHPSGQVLNGRDPVTLITTVQRDYRASNGRRQDLPPSQLKRVKESHIVPPCQEQLFSTSHHEDFIPFPMCRPPAIDRHSQLYSHIPV